MSTGMPVADISSFQPDTLEFFKWLKGNMVWSVIIKLTQGSEDGDAYINSKAAKQIANARKAGLKVHVYHYAKFTSKADAKNEAKFFVKVMKKLKITAKSVAAVDVEDAALPKGDITKIINAFNAEVIANGYKKTDVYSMASWFWDGKIKRTGLKPKPNLWVANYGATQPGVDKVGTWQFTDKFLGKNLDMSYDFSGYYTE